MVNLSPEAERNPRWDNREQGFWRPRSPKILRFKTISAAEEPRHGSSLRSQPIFEELLNPECNVANACRDLEIMDDISWD